MSPAPRLGPFALEAVVGRGGAGEVWRARHATGRATVAVKVVAAAQARTAAGTSAFAREVEAVAGLRHPAIVTVLDHGRVDARAARRARGALAEGSPYLVMEFAAGGALRPETVRRWHDLRALLVALLDALAHAHARGLVHRDIKPGNVLARAAGGGWCLSDFGIAHALDAGTPGAPRSGTPRYMAPEQFLGAWRDFGPWTDLYALGCVAYELACGRPPFEGDPGALAACHLGAAAPRARPRFAAPPGLAGWLARMLARPIERRYGLAADALHALRAVDGEGLRGSPALDARPAPLPPTLDATRDGLPAPAGTPPDEAPRDPGARAGDAPPMVARWDAPGTEPPSRLAGVGLGLFGLREAPVLGRRAERDALWHALGAVHAARAPRAVVLRGAAGFGKSRLARWLTERAHEVGAATSLRATHAPGGGPAHGLAAMLARHLRCEALAPDALRRRLRARLPAATEDVRDGLAALLGGARVEGARRYVLAREVLALEGAARPVIAWLDDVHWGADALGLVEHCLGTAGEAPLPVLFVLTARDEALVERPAEAAALARLAARGDVRGLAVGPLSPTAQAELIENLVPVDRRLAARLAARTGGQPLFAVHLLEDWVHRGLLAARDGGYDLRPGAATPLPEDLYQVWSALVAGLLARHPPEMAAALELAAALGRVVDPGEWAALCDEAGLPRPDALADELSRRRLMVDEDGRRGFVHELLREAVERRAAEGGRARGHHRRCASMLLARLPPGQPGREERVGRHLHAAGQWSDAAPRLLEGARERYVRGEYALLDELVTRAEEALARQGVPRTETPWAEGWELRARAYLWQGRAEEARRWAEDALAVARRHGRADLEAGALHHLAKLDFDRHDFGAAEARFLRALEVSEAGGDAVGVGRSLLALSCVALRRGHVTDARRFAERTRAACRGPGAGSLAAVAEQQSGVIDRTEGDHAAAARRLGASLEACAREHYPLGVAQAHHELGTLALARGDVAGAEAAFERAVALLHALGAYTEAAEPRSARAAAWLLAGRRDEAARELAAVAALVARTGTCIPTCTLLGGRLACAADRGDWAAWDEHRAALDAWPAAADLLVSARPVLAEACALARRRGSPERAAALAAWARARAAAFGLAPVGG